jgi:hypothetical protein
MPLPAGRQVGFQNSFLEKLFHQSQTVIGEPVTLQGIRRCFEPLSRYLDDDLVVQERVVSVGHGEGKDFNIRAVGLTHDELDSIKRWIEIQVPRAMCSVLQHAADSPYGVTNQIDFCGFDVMVSRTREGLACSFIEANGDGSGGVYALHELGVHDETVTHGILSTMVRRARQYYERIAA